MQKKATLKDAIDAWLASGHPRSEMRRFSTAQLYDFLTDPEHCPQREAIMACLGDSTADARALVEIAANLAAAERQAFTYGWDMALAAAADAPEAGMRRVRTEHDKYTIDIRPRLDDPRMGLVIVRVNPTYAEALEGKPLVLADANRPLLRGAISAGEVSGEVEGVDQIGSDLSVWTG